MTKNNQARQDCLTLWGELANTGENNKKTAINRLYQEGKISKPYYWRTCPACELVYITEIARPDCHCCPLVDFWKKFPASHTWECTCEKHDTPWNEWRTAGSAEEGKSAAKKMVAGIKQYWKEDEGIK